MKRQRLYTPFYLGMCQIRRSPTLGTQSLLPKLGLAAQYVWGLGFMAAQPEAMLNNINNANPFIQFIFTQSIG